MFDRVLNTLLNIAQTWVALIKGGKCNNYYRHDKTEDSEIEAEIYRGTHRGCSPQHQIS